MSTRTGVLNPRVRREVVHSSVTCLETKIPGWEAKETLTEKDRQSIVRTLKRLQELNQEFIRYHYSIVELLEDAEVLAEEQAVLDQHEDKVEDLIGRLEDLATTTELLRPHAYDEREATSGLLKNEKRLKHLKLSLIHI